MFNSRRTAKRLAEANFLLRQHVPPTRLVPEPLALWSCSRSTQDLGGCEVGSPESSLSPRSDLSVPSNPPRSAQSLSSYNPFEDEDDTGSTVSEKEDIKPKKLVNKRFPLVSTSLALSVSSSLSRVSAPRRSKPCWRPSGSGPAASRGQSLAFQFLREGAPVNNLWLLSLCPPLTVVKASAQEDRPAGWPGLCWGWCGPEGSPTVL